MNGEMLRILQTLNMIEGAVGIEEIISLSGLSQGKVLGHLPKLFLDQFIEKKGKLFVISKKGKRILGEIELIPENRAFYFYINENIYTGRVAYNIKDFLEIIKTIDVNAIEFHVQRKDFEKWIREVFVDEEFAKEVAEIGMLRISGENLRERLYEVVDKKHKMLNLFLI